MPEIYILQACDDKALDANVEGLLQQHHTEYCAKHGMKYVFMRMKREEAEGRNLTWLKIVAIRRHLAVCADGDMLIWVDMDAVIRRTHIDLRGAFPNDKAQLCTAVYYGTDMTLPNAGVMYIRVCPAIRKFFDKVWETGPLQENMDEESTIRKLLPAAIANGLEYEIISNRWNAWLQFPHPNPNVQAYHGCKCSASDKCDMLAAIVLHPTSI